jgi:transcriptional regulator with XRE-family HTH domain
MPGFNDRLRLLRTSQGLSQSELAKFLGISESSVNMYERGEREPGLETLEAIGDFFNVDMDYLHGRTDVKNRYVVFNRQVLPSLPYEDGVFPELLKTYEELNTDGRQKVYERATELAELPKYQLTPATDDAPHSAHSPEAMIQKYREQGYPVSDGLYRESATTARVASPIILPTPEDTDDKK